MMMMMMMMIMMMMMMMDDDDDDDNDDDDDKIQPFLWQVSAMLNATPEYGKLPKTTVDF